MSTNEKGTPQSRTYTVNDIATILGIGRASAYKLANSGLFKTIRIGGLAEGGGPGRRNGITSRSAVGLRPMTLQDYILPVNMYHLAFGLSNRFIKFHHVEFR